LSLVQAWPICYGDGVADTRATDVTDLEEARALIATLQTELARAQRETAQLRHQIDVLCRRLFGKQSEKVDPRQLQLALEQLANEPGPVTEPIEMDSGETPVRGHVRRQAHGRQILPSGLPREVITVDVPDTAKTCGCGTRKVVIGTIDSEKLDYVPASLRIRQTSRLKYACPVCHDGVVEAPAPPQAIEKSLAAEGLLAHVVVSKYADHLPLHRLSGILAREGLTLAPSTLCDWVADVATALAPIDAQLRQEVTASGYLQTDDTPVTVLDRGGGSFTGRLWTYLDPVARQVVFDATPTHARAGPEAVLATFTGYLQADAYTGYDALYRTGRIVEVGCWAHARRRFVDALETDGAAAPVLALIQQIYQVEREFADATPEARRAGRQGQAAARLARLDQVRHELATRALPKSPLGDALRYLDQQWTVLQRYLADGQLLIDNNNAERQLRTVAVGRKNWLFAGSFEGARRAALLYSLIQSCRLIDVSPFQYLRDVLLRIATHPHRHLQELTPKGWKATFGPSRST
jgi:transposase